MFDELLSQFESVLAQAKNTKRPTKSQSQTRVPAESPFFDPTKKFGQVASFGKTQRFKDQPKQQLKTSHIVWEQHKEVPPSEVKKFSFKKSERFEAEKPQYNQTYINPDFKVIKKNTGNNVPVYKVPTGKDLAKSNVSVSTNASESLRGPGIYDVKEESKIKNGAFAKDNRFKQQKVTYEDTPLMINQNQTKKRPPSCTVMKTKTAKTKQTISLEQQEQLRQKLKMIYWKSMPLEMDRLLKNNRAAFIRENYFDFATLRGRHKRAALMMMLDRLNYLRGGYEQNIRTQMDAACAVVYRKSTPKPFKFSEMQPGPDYYYPVDDYIKPNAPNFSFSKEGIKEKPIEYDYRQYEINEQLFKKGCNIIINPLHQELRLSQEQIANIERGPGFYDCIFKLVQKRADIGVVKFQEITQKNDRQNNCVQIKQVNDGIYFPSYNAIDPNVAAPLYRKPANVKPAHIPDKILFPEHWLFYDGDLNKVRAQIAKNVLLAKNMNFKEYQVYKDQMKRFKEYLQIQRRTPEVGQYLVSYKALDPHVPNIQFSKQEEKNLLDPITKPEGQADGDNLILNPKKFEDHLPNIDFKKMEGRGLQPQQDLDQQPKQGDVLLLNPQKPQKHVPNVFFEKQEGRPQDISLQNESGPQGDILILNPKPVQPHIPQVDFSKQAQRQQIQIQQNENEQVNILNPKIEGPTVKGVPFSRLSSVRMVPLLRQKSKIKNSDQ